MSDQEKKDKIYRSFANVQLTSSLDPRNHDLSKGLITQLGVSGVYPQVEALTAHRERSPLCKEGQFKKKNKVKRSSAHSSTDSGDDYDTDLETELPLRYCEPPSRSSPQSQVKFYETVCSKIGIVPISTYAKSLGRTSCLLNYRKINDAEGKALTLPLQVNSSISRLELKENLLSTIGAKWIAQLIRENTTLISLDLSENKGAFDKEDSLKDLCNALVSNKTLRELNLSGNRIQDSCAGALEYLLQKSRSLHSLILRHNELSSEGARRIALGLSQNEHLKALDLSWNHLRLEGTSVLAFSLQENVTLKKLCLAMNGFGIAGALSLALALKDNSSLIELDISNNRIPVDGVAQFGKIFSSNETLEILRMGQNPMQIHGSYALIKFLHDSNNKSLQILDLTDVMVLDIFMEVVMRIKSFNPGFRVKVGTIVSSPSIRLETGKSREISTENPLMIVVTYMESQRMRIVDLFKTWDADNSMSLTRDEFKEGLQSINTPLTENQLDELIEMLDGDGNGEIELSELIQAIEKDNKGIRRKAALAAKADGPFPTNTYEEKPPAEKNILEEMNEMVEEGHSNAAPFSSEYDSALIIEGNPRYRVPLKSRRAKRESLLESDFDF